MKAYMTNRQGTEFARMARDKKVPREKIEQRGFKERVFAMVLDAIKNDQPITIGPPLEYPNWVREHLTPGLEAQALRDPGEVELWLDPRQRTGNPIGHDVHAAVKSHGLIERSISYGDLKFLEKNPERIPAEFRGKWIYGWASVVRDADGFLHVPCLDCDVDRPYVNWRWLDLRWHIIGPAGLRAS